MMKFRLRFSVRTLAVFVTLVCAYFAAWEATKRYGLSRRTEETRGFDSSGFPHFTFVDIVEARSPMPFVVVRLEHESTASNPERMGLGMDLGVTKRSYLWLCGPTIKLPFQSEW